MPSTFHEKIPPPNENKSRAAPTRFGGVVDFLSTGDVVVAYTNTGGRAGAGRVHPDQRRYTHPTTIAVCRTRPNTRAHHHRSFS